MSGGRLQGQLDRLVSSWRTGRNAEQDAKYACHRACPDLRKEHIVSHRTLSFLTVDYISGADSLVDS